MNDGGKGEAVWLLALRNSCIANDGRSPNALHLLKVRTGRSFSKGVLKTYQTFSVRDSAFGSLHLCIEADIYKHQQISYSLSKKQSMRPESDLRIPHPFCMINIHFQYLLQATPRRHTVVLSIFFNESAWTYSAISIDISETV